MCHGFEREIDSPIPDAWWMSFSSAQCAIRMNGRGKKKSKGLKCSGERSPSRSSKYKWKRYDRCNINAITHPFQCPISRSRPKVLMRGTREAEISLDLRTDEERKFENGFAAGMYALAKSQGTSPKFLLSYGVEGYAPCFNLREGRRSHA